MKRGDIYYINSTHAEQGHEIRAGRPAVIVSNDKNNECSGTVEVVYMTTKPKNDMPTHVFTRSSREPSTILCEQITTVSKDRVGDYYGRLADNELQILDNALAISLGLDFGAAPVMREPTDEELEKAWREWLARPENHLFFPDDYKSPELIKTETERDIYQKLYTELLEHVKGEN
jgi:mRNA interferase MazF